MKFYRNLSFFQIEADIQGQRYYKEEGIEKFRISCLVSCERFTSRYGRKTFFGYYPVAQDDSWITVDGDTRLEILSNWLRGKLKQLSEFIEIYSDIEKVIERLKESQDIAYAFLLKECGKNKELTGWRALRENERTKYLSLIKEIEEEKQQLESCPNSLNRVVRLEGVTMQLGDLARKLARIDNEMHMVE